MTLEDRLEMLESSGWSEGDQRAFAIRLEGRLETLESSGLIHLAQVEPELEYLFRHALVQEAAYESLLKLERKRLHLAVGEALEQMYPDQLTSRELSPVLGRHFYEAGDDQRALRYFTLAGDAEAAVYANAEAVAHYTRALQVADSSTDTESLIHLFTSRGRALELGAQYEQASRGYSEMEQLGRERGDRRLELTALMMHATLCATVNPMHNPAQAEAFLARATDLAHELGDRAAQARILWNQMLLIIYSEGDQEQGIAYGEQALALARELGAREQIAFTLNDLAGLYNGSRPFAKAMSTYEEAVALWRELGNKPMLADTLMGISYAYLYAGEYVQAIASGQEARRIAHSIGNAWGQASSLIPVSRAHFDLGQVGPAIEAMQQSLELATQAQHVLALVETHISLAWNYARLGQVQRGWEIVQHAVAQLANQPETSYTRMLAEYKVRLHILEGDLAAAQAARAEISGEAWTGIDVELALALQDYPCALEAVNDRLAQLEKANSPWLVPHALYHKSIILFKLGQPDAALALLTQARVRAEAMNSRWILWQILALAGEIEAQRGNASQAQALRCQAREVIEYIVAHIDEPDLRASFLDLPRVRAVMEAG